MDYVPTIDFFPSVTDKSTIKLYTRYELYDAYANSPIWSQYNRQTGTYDHLECYDFMFTTVCYTIISRDHYDYNDIHGDAQVRAVKIHTGTNNIYQAFNNSDGDGKQYVPTEIGYRVVEFPEKLVRINEYGSVRKIHPHAFDGVHLQNFPFDGVEEIGDYAFRNTTALNQDLTLTYLSKLKIVGKGAFYGSAITKFEAPTTLTSIGKNAFFYCSNLHEIFLPHIDGKHPLTCGSNFFGNNVNDFKCLLYNYCYE